MNDKLKQHVSALEAMDAEIDNIKADRKLRVKAAKDDGIDVKAMNRVIRERRMDSHELEVHEFTVAQYKLDLGMAVE